MKSSRIWRVKRLGQQPAELRFPARLSEAEVREIYDDCYCEPIPDDADRAKPQAEGEPDET